MIENEQIVDVSTPRPSALQPVEQPPGDEPETAVDTGAEAAFAGASSPHEYRFDVLPGVEFDDAYMADEQGIRQALHAEGIPAGIASLGHMLIQNAVRNGLPDDARLELARRTGAAELQRRHGEGAAQVIAAAKRVFDRLDARDPRLGDLLANTGVASDPNFIESLARLSGVRGGR
jgi:hypothetical protein